MLSVRRRSVSGNMIFRPVDVRDCGGVVVRTMDRDRRQNPMAVQLS